jgi:hypothetical protein
VTQSRPRRPDIAKQAVQSAVAVQYRAVASWVQQPTVVVLTMQLHQHIRQLPQDFARHPTVIDPACLAPVDRVHTPQDQFIRDRQPRIAKNRTGRMISRDIEYGRHLALVSALPDQFGPAAPPQHEPKRVQQDRLSRPRFTGKHIETRLKHQIQPVDDQNIPDLKRT